MTMVALGRHQKDRKRLVTIAPTTRNANEESLVQMPTKRCPNLRRAKLRLGELSKPQYGQAVRQHFHYRSTEKLTGIYIKYDDVYDVDQYITWVSTSERLTHGKRENKQYSIAIGTLELRV